MTDVLTLEQFVPELSPRFAAPVHLRPLADLFHRVCNRESVRAVVSIPPRRGKTELVLHAIAWLLLQHPEMQIAYASYAARLAEKKSRRARELSRRAGVPLAADAASRQDWRTGVDEGGLWATSTAGPITGEGFELILLDDLVRGRAEAESAAHRDRIRGWLTMDVLTRLEPRGSIILLGTRWHPDDPAGFALGLGWEHVNLTAITPEGRSLWPERWPIEQVLALRQELGGEDGYEWQSLYCGNPRSRGTRVFGDVELYDDDERPEQMQVAIGLDFAYSSRTTADWSVAVVLGRQGGEFYVLDVVRVREEPAIFRDRVRALLARYPSARLQAYIGGTERGVIAFFSDHGIHVNAAPATVDKFTRAIPCAAAWNTGKLMVPRRAAWTNSFVSELCGFTGVNDPHDDQIDALAAAYDLLSYSAIGKVEVAGGEDSVARSSGFGFGGHGGGFLDPSSRFIVHRGRLFLDNGQHGRSSGGNSSQGGGF